MWISITLKSWYDVILYALHVCWKFLHRYIFNRSSILQLWSWGVSAPGKQKVFIINTYKGRLCDILLCLEISLEISASLGWHTEDWHMCHQGQWQQLTVLCYITIVYVCKAGKGCILFYKKLWVVGVQLLSSWGSAAPAKKDRKRNNSGWRQVWRWQQWVKRARIFSLGELRSFEETPYF